MTYWEQYSDNMYGEKTHSSCLPRIVRCFTTMEIGLDSTRNVNLLTYFFFVEVWVSGYRPMMDRLFKSILSIREFKIRVDDDYTDRCVWRQMVQNMYKINFWFPLLPSKYDIHLIALHLYIFRLENVPYGKYSIISGLSHPMHFISIQKKKKKKKRIIFLNCISFQLHINLTFSFFL